MSLSSLANKLNDVNLIPSTKTYRHRCQTKNMTCSSILITVRELMQTAYFTHCHGKSLPFQLVIISTQVQGRQLMLITCHTQFYVIRSAALPTANAVSLRRTTGHKVLFVVKLLEMPRTRLLNSKRRNVLAPERSLNCTNIPTPLSCNRSKNSCSKAADAVFIAVRTKPPLNVAVPQRSTGGRFPKAETYH